VLLDLDYRGEKGSKEGLEYLPKIIEKIPEVPIIVATNEDKVSIVVEAMKLGAKAFLVKSDFDREEWLTLFQRTVAEAKLEQENETLKKRVKKVSREKQRLEAQNYPFIGNSPRIEEVKKDLQYAAEHPELTVLLTGETGVGKEVAARYLYKHSSRDNENFVPVQLNTISKELMESRLFGHKKGAFTGALEDVTGYFHEADKGILFLDEIGDVDLEIQGKLLRFLEQKIIRPVGSNKDILLSIQVVSATNKNLKKEVEKGSFREDLYYRLNVIPIEIPPLRERINDLPLLLSHYLKVPLNSLKNLISEEALNMLFSYNWPGNIRELKHIAEGMKMRKQRNNLEKYDPSCLPSEIRNYSPIPDLSKTKTAILPEEESKPIKIDLSQPDKQIAYINLQRIEDALEETYGQKRKTAELLGLNLDQLLYKIKKYIKSDPEIVASFPNIVENYKRFMDDQAST